MGPMRACTRDSWIDGADALMRGCSTLLPDARQLSCGARVGQVHICLTHLHQVCARPKNSTRTPISLHAPFPRVM